MKRQVLRKPAMRHPLHWIAGFISGACLFNPDTAIAITSSIITFLAFAIYEYWEDRDVGDQGWRDWWEFMTAYFMMALIRLTGV